MGVIDKTRITFLPVVITLKMFGRYFLLYFVFNDFNTALAEKCLLRNQPVSNAQLDIFLHCWFDSSTYFPGITVAHNLP